MVRTYVGSTEVEIRKEGRFFFKNEKVRFKDTNAGKWVGNAEAIRILYNLIQKKEIQFRTEVIMDAIAEYEAALNKVSASR